VFAEKTEAFDALEGRSGAQVLHRNFTDTQWPDRRSVGGVFEAMQPIEPVVLSGVAGTALAVRVPVQTNSSRSYFDHDCSSSTFPSGSVT